MVARARTEKMVIGAGVPLVTKAFTVNWTCQYAGNNTPMTSSYSPPPHAKMEGDVSTVPDLITNVSVPKVRSVIFFQLLINFEFDFFFKF